VSNILHFPLNRVAKPAPLLEVPAQHQAWLDALEAALAVYKLAEDSGNERDARSAWGCVCAAYDRVLTLRRGQAGPAPSDRQAWPTVPAYPWVPTADTPPLTVADLARTEFEWGY
jgi:hypothetical protein